MIENKPMKNPGPGQKELHEHIKGRGVISNLALGLSDGLVTNISFLAGFGGAISNISVIRIAGFAVMLAGAVSMFFGGLLSGRAERELFKADAARERSEIESEPEEEKEELRSLYMKKGLTRKEAGMVVKRVTSDKRKWLDDLLTEELHLHEAELEDPLKIAAATGMAFLIGALVPLVPYLLFSIKSQALPSSVILSLIFLFAAGYWKGHLVGRRKWQSALELLIVGVVASVLLYAFGSLLAFA